MSPSRFSTCRFGVASAAGLLLASLSAPANAVLLAYDPFDIGAGPSQYAAGDDGTGINVLGGQNPTIGPAAFYSGAWIQSGGDAQAVKDIGSLSYPLFPQSGGQVQETLQFSCCTFGRTARAIAGGLGGRGVERTLYQSFLIDFGSQGTDDPASFGKRGYEMWNGGIGDAFLAVDLFVNHFAGINELTLGVTTASGTQSVAVSGGGLTLEDLLGVHLMVFKFEFKDADPDAVSLYLDPIDSNEAAYTAAAAISIPTSDLEITHHGVVSQFTFSGSGHTVGAFDELRWGETFADVTPFLSPPPVPEPSSLSLLALTLSAAGLARRRRTAARGGQTTVP